MKAISFFAAITVLSSLLLCACTSQIKDKDRQPTVAASSTVTTSETVTIEDEDVPLDDDTAESGNTAEMSYISALSEQQKQEILDFADNWYKENFSEYKVLSMDFAEDDNAGYAYYSELKPGEIIILQVHTTHGSKKKADGTIDGSPRDFFVRITDEGYEFLNEGY